MVTPQKMMLMWMNSQKKPQELCRRCHLPLGLRRQRLQGIQRCIARSFGNLAMKIAETKSLHSSIVGIGRMSSQMFCRKCILGHGNAPTSVPNVKSSLSVNFPVCSLFQKLGVSQHLPSKAHQYDISSEGEGRPDEVPSELAPSDHSNEGEQVA